jgi:hypothetical protein
MNFAIHRQEKYSQGQLLLRTFFGYFYILIPHGIVLQILGIWTQLSSFIAFLSCLFTGKYPKGIFNWQVRYMRWSMRVQTRIMNMRDGYPKFGMDAEDNGFVLDFTYPEKVNQGKVLLRLFLGFFMAIPHIFILYFRIIGVMFIMLAAWFSILFTAKYPEGMFRFVEETMRWMLRVQAYFGLFTDTYPPFTGKVLPGENENIGNARSGVEGVIDN